MHAAAAAGLASTSGCGILPAMSSSECPWDKDPLVGPIFQNEASVISYLISFLLHHIDNSSESISFPPLVVAERAVQAQSWDPIILGPQMRRGLIFTTCSAISREVQRPESLMSREGGLMMWFYAWPLSFSRGHASSCGH